MSFAFDLFERPARQAAVLEDVEHRPWPVPDEPWAQAQTWDDLLFAHWRVPAGTLRAHLPPGLQLETFDGDAWLGVTPFVVSGLRLRGLPPVPFLSSFPECNVRTYVTLGGKPGIWFFSLDAGSAVAVEAARLSYRLPYFRARMTAARGGGFVAYESARSDGRGHPAVLSARYRGDGDFLRPEAGSLEHFLTERYCLYAADGDALWRAEIQHPPWALQAAEAEIALNTMPPSGIELAGEPLLHLAARQDVVIWPLRTT